ncbi:MAG: EAL domain-containing protein [Gammaproteobacteria bacterium]|nr:EAL domain-containing protein [Gammaproteobacteria bacterium]
MPQTIGAGLRARILLPVAVALALLLGAFALTFYQHERDDAAQSFVHDMQAAENYYRRALLQRADKLGATLEALVRDEALQAALRARDREALLRQSMPLYRRLRTQYAITHFYFEDAARINVLRVHQPERFGDIVDRHTILEAEKTDAPASGMELGPIGTLTLRVVAPVHDRGGRIGYVELGEETESVLHSITDVLGTEHLLAIDKRYLTRSDWEEGMRMLQRDADWERLPDFALVHQTLALPREQLLHILSRKTQADSIIEMNVAGKRYYAGTLQIDDAEGRTVGRLIVLRDRTQALAVMTAALRSFGAFYLALGGGLFYLLYLVVRRTQRRLEQVHRRDIDQRQKHAADQTRHIVELEAERDKLRSAEQTLKNRETSLARAQQIAHLGSWEWDIVGNGLHWSDEIYRIFGLKPREFGATYETFMEHVHPDDRDRVNRAVNAALTDNQPYVIEHRVVRPDGTERIVMERADVVRDAAGAPILMAGTVQDISERKHAESELRLTAQVFENSIEGIVITDAHGNILRVNRAFTNITGYAEKDILGHNPRLLRSGRHDAAFYQAMWASLLEYGYWQGEIWNRRKNGDIYPEWLSLIAIRDERGNTLHYAGVFADLTEKKQAEARAHYLAYYDTLTELPNRQLLEERLKQALTAAPGNHRMTALLHLDLDRFRHINDSLGYAFGDRLLRAVASRLTEHIRGSDTLARFTGDEFAVMLADIGDVENAAQVAEKILATMTQPFELDGREIFVTPSIGIAVYPLDGDDKDDLIKAADTAMGHAKTQGGNTYRFYNSEMNQGISQRLTLESSLRRALEREEFLLHYQPQVSLSSGAIIGMEALLRWQHPERGLIAPAEFIPLLEENGLIVPVGEWVLRTACAQTSRWRNEGLLDLRVAVNLSERQFRQSDLTAMVDRVLRETDLTPQQLELEITESLMIQDVQTTITTLHQLHTLGIQISIDDFGTGYSSLSYLKKLPIGKIKIDQSFVREICVDPDDAAIANSIIGLGHSLRMQVIAEGVETVEQLEYLCAQGCDEIQGYYFSRPLPAENFARLIGEKKVLAPCLTDTTAP